MRQLSQQFAFQRFISYLIIILCLLAGNTQAGLTTCKNHYPRPITYFSHQDNTCPECSKKPGLRPLHVQTPKWNKAALQVFTQLTGDSQKNQIISSHSINEMLTMLAAGSAGQTLASTTRKMGTTPEEFRSFSQLLHMKEDGTSKDGSVDAFASYNTILVSSRHELTQKYTDYVDQNFAQPIDIRPNQDFSNPLVVKALAQSTSNEVCRVTRNMIRECVNADRLLEQNPALVLANATYLEGKWDVAFTKEDDFFYRHDGRLIPASMVSATNRKIRYGTFQGWELVSIPYKGRFEMMIVLPPVGVLPGTMTDQQLTGLISAIQDKHDVTVKMPEYMFDMSYELDQVFATSEPGNMFSSSADFSEMVKHPPICLSAMTHKVVIQTDKEGTKVAALTVTEAVDCAFDEQETYVNCNRPFLFLICDKQHKAIRFIGQIHDPGYYQPEE